MSRHQLRAVEANLCCIRAEPPGMGRETDPLLSSPPAAMGLNLELGAGISLRFTRPGRSRPSLPWSTARV